MTRVLDFALQPMTGALMWVLTREEEDLYKLWTPTGVFFFDENLHPTNTKE